MKELTKSDWLEILNLPETKVPAVLILRGTRNFRSQYRDMLPYFENVREVDTPNGIIEDVLVGDLCGRPVGFACVYGSSMASEVVHVFGVLGTRAVIQIGNCGALADDLGAGDLFLAEWAYCGEGAAQYYHPDGKRVEASTRLLQSETLAKLGPGAYRRGAIYTTAALFAEGAEDLERWYREGFAAVDLETATTYAVAEYFGMDRLSILYGFDNPRRREHLLLSEKEKDVRRAAANRTMTQLALDLAAELCAKDGRPIGPPSNRYVVRGCRPEEAEAVLALWRQAGATVSLTDTTAELRRTIADNAALVVVAEQEGELIGSAIGSFDGWRGNIYRLVVRPDCRRRGIARALVAEVERRLVQQGAKRITALVEKDHTWATAFWKAIGYELDRRIARFVHNLESSRLIEMDK